MKIEAPKVGDREIRERVSRCVSTMVFYRADGSSRPATKLLRSEVGSLADWSSRSGLDDGLAASVLDPLERELVVRFGDSDGRKLHREFLRALRAETRKPSAE